MEVLLSSIGMNRLGSGMVIRVPVPSFGARYPVLKRTIPAANKVTRAELQSLFASELGDFKAAVRAHRKR